VAKVVVDRFAAFAATVPKGGTLAPLAVAAGRDWLHGDDRARDVLFVQLESSSGETITQRSLWRNSREALVMGGVA
jgi:hypothetical protein